MGLNNWMADLDPSQTINLISIPGTHESCARYDHATAGYTQCQWLSITDQLLNGIRFLDIRCTYEVDGKPFEITHGGYDQNVTFADVQKEVIDFLTANPTEFVLMNVQQEYSKNTDQHFLARFQSLVAGFEDYWFFETRIPTVAEARRRIILIRAGQWWTKGIPWNGYSIDGNSSNAYFETQNAWTAWESNKVAAIKAMLSGSFYQQGKIVLNFLSYAHGGATPGRNAEAMNPEIHRYIQHIDPSHCLGVLPMDFATNTPGFIEEIIRHNYFPAGADLIRIIYREVLNREPDPEGLTFYTQALRSGSSSSQVRAEIARSPESRENIQYLYRKYLSDEADPAVIDHYVTLLATHALTIVQVETAIRNSNPITLNP